MKESKPIDEEINTEKEVIQGIKNDGQYILNIPYKFIKEAIGKNFNRRFRYVK